jgi:hypothetical protein
VSVLFFSSPFVWYISHCKKNWARWCHKRTKILMEITRFFGGSEFDKTLIFSSRDFRKIMQYQISWISVQWELSNLRTEQNDLTRLIVSFRNFANALENTSCSTKRAKPTERYFRIPPRSRCDMRSSGLFLRRMVLIAYRRFGATHRYNFQAKLSSEDWTGRLCWNVGKELLL